MQIRQVRPEIIASLNSQYLTQRFSANLSFLQMVQQCSNAIKESIHRVKYQLTTDMIHRYAIKFEQPLEDPFDPIELSFLLQLASVCDRVVVEPAHKNISILNEFVKAGKLNDLALNEFYLPFGISFRFVNLKEALVYTALSQCQVWYTICRERKKNKKQFELDPLINYWQNFVERQKLVTPFHVSVLPRKQIRNIEKKAQKQKIQNSLYDAVYNQNHELAKQLLHKGAKVEMPAFINSRKKTQVKCAHRACLNDDLAMCKLLDSFNANWEADDSEKMSPIFYAIQGGSLRIIKFLVEEKKVNIEKQDIQSRTPFYWACTQGDLDIIDYLYKSGSNINHKSELGRTALSKSCYLGRRDIVEYLLDCKEIDMYSQCKKGRTALHNAIFGPKGGREGHKFGTNEKDSPDCAQIMLQKGMDVDILDNQQCTPLHVAMSSDAIDSIRMLMAYSASLTAKNNYGEVPLMTGAKFGHVDSCQILYHEYNCNILQTDIFNKNILLLTAKFSHFQPSDQADNYGPNPVYYYFLDPFVKKCKEEKMIEELHRTLFEMLTSDFNAKMLDEIESLWRCFKENQIPRPKLGIELIEKVLNLSISKQKESKSKNSKKKEHIQEMVEEREDMILAVQLLKDIELAPEKLEEVYIWLIKNNEPKVLEFVHYHELLYLNKVELKPSIMFEMIQDEGLQLKEKVVTFCLLCLSFDWTTYRTEENTNIVHLLVKKQRTGCLIQIFKALSGKIPPQIVTNRYLRNLSPERGNQILENLLWEKDVSGLDAYKLSLILKNKSISKLIEDKTKQLHLQPSSSLDICDYEPILHKCQHELLIFSRQSHEREEEVVKMQSYITEMEEEELTHWLSFWNKIKAIIKVGLEQGKDKSDSFWKKCDERPLHFISEKGQLQILKKFYEETLIGIDVQFFNQEGITIISTLQISSITQDAIIDCLSVPLKEIKPVISPILYNPKSLKIMHGAQNDLVLIKSSFNLSLINFIDTSKLDLEIRKNQHDLRGLATLCKEYLGLTLSKEYQLSQWRIRPLPHPMLQYARKDALILPHLLVEMLSRVENPEVMRQILLSGCRQVRRNKKLSQPLLMEIKKR